MSFLFERVIVTLVRMHGSLRHIYLLPYHKSSQRTQVHRVLRDHSMMQCCPSFRLYSSVYTVNCLEMYRGYYSNGTKQNCLDVHINEGRDSIGTEQ